MTSLVADKVAATSAKELSPWGDIDRLDNSTAKWKQPETTFRELPSSVETGEVIGQPYSSISPIRKIEETFQALFASGREEFFEDGMETEFSRNLVALIDKLGDEAIKVLDELIIGERVNSEVASEALRWVGHIDTPSTHLGRRRLLQRSLDCSSSRIRDGAALGLAFMDDPSAIPDLERAIEKEPIRELQQDMKQVLAQLKDTLVENAL